MKHKNPDELIQMNVKLPAWMVERIDHVRKQNRQLTRTEATRSVLVAGFEALGVDLPPIEQPCHQMQ